MMRLPALIKIQVLLVCGFTLADLLQECATQSSEQLTTMAKGRGFLPSATECQKRPCAILRTPVEQDWNLIKAALETVIQHKGPSNVDMLKALQENLLFLSGNLRSDEKIKRQALIEHLSESPRNFFTDVLPFLASLTKHIDLLFPSGLQYLSADLHPELHLQKVQVLALLASAFLGVIPHNQKRLLEAHPKKFTLRLNKLDMYYRGFMDRKPKFISLLVYFRTMYRRIGSCWLDFLKNKTVAGPLGCSGACECRVVEGRKYSMAKAIVSFFRVSSKGATFSTLSENVSERTEAIHLSDLRNSKKPIFPLHVQKGGDITTADGMLQMDFADEFVGGLCMYKDHIAQEELLFIVYPELIVLMLFNTALGEDEAIIIKGIERFVFCDGYENSFTVKKSASRSSLKSCDGHCGTQGVVPLDPFGRPEVSVVAVDAMNFSTLSKEAPFQKKWINRDLLKALVGFRGDPYENIIHGVPQSVAGGYWGCSIFGGDVHMKLLIMMLAASFNGRALVFYTFGDNRLPNMQYYADALMIKYGSVGSLYRALMDAVDRLSTKSGGALWKLLLS